MVCASGGGTVRLPVSGLWTEHNQRPLITHMFISFEDHALAGGACWVPEGKGCDGNRALGIPVLIF